jgi:membrane peptidoglycan carboxypeptidase
VSTTLTPPSSEKSGLAALPGMSEHVHHHRPSKLLAILVLSVVAGLLVAVLALPLIGSIGVGAKASADFFDNLPTQLVVPPLPQRSVILDAAGNKIATLHGTEDRVSIPFSDIPVSMRHAIVAIEDRRFYEHHGVDYKGIIRAALTNQENGSVTQGGSTLTQQYVKNVLLESATTPAERKAATDRSVQRKLREARYALALERKLTKDQILTNYLNIANFGDGAYGVEAAAEHYFGIHAKQLNVVQSATLAGIVNGPTEYDPKLHPKAALSRRNLVLSQMVVAKYINKPTEQYAKTFPLGLSTAYKPASDGCETAGSAAFFCDYVRSTLLSDPKFGSTADDRYRRLFDGGLTIQTSLDPKVQADAQNAVDTVIPAGGRIATAAVVIQPGTGNVLAMAVNRVYGDTTDHLPVYGPDPKGKLVESKDRVHTKFNYAISYPGYQPGSTFKMFTLAAALEKGLSTSTSFFSPSCIYLTNFGNNPTGGNQQCIADVPAALGGQLPPFGQGYANSDPAESAIYNMASATAGSVNTYFVQLEKKVGLGPIRDMAQRLGVKSPSLNGPADDLGGSLTLGSHEVSPLDMATAYATIAAHGLRCFPKPVLSMTVGGKPVSYTAAPKCQQVLKAGIADTVTSLLQGVIQYGTGAGNGQIGRPAAGKTGTTDNHFDAWFDGYIPQLAAAVWVGDGRSPTKYPLLQCYSVGCTTPDGVSGVPNWPASEEVFGGGLPTIIWANLMRAASADLPVVDFPPADLATEIGITALVPNVAGMDLGSATNALTAAGFTPVSGGGAPSAYTPGTVAYTTPGGGIQAPQGSQVTIFTSTGPAPLPPPVTKAPVVKTPTKAPVVTPPAKAKVKVKAPVTVRPPKH